MFLRLRSTSFTPHGTHIMASIMAIMPFDGVRAHQRYGDLMSIEITMVIVQHDVIVKEAFPVHF